MALPTAEQLAYAQVVADRLGKTIDPEWLKDGLILSMWAKSEMGKVIEKFGHGDGCILN